MPDDLTEGWALRSDSLKSRVLHYFRERRSLCARHWPQSGVTLYAKPHGMLCPECTHARMATLTRERDEARQQLLTALTVVGDLLNRTFPDTGPYERGIAFHAEVRAFLA